MPQAVTVYRWDDPGAPQIVQRRPSEIIAILKKCLVEGYGVKAPLGWSVLFEDTATQKIIFQNSIAAGGSGGVLRVKTGNSGNAVDANTFFTPAKSAVDIDTLFQAGHRHRGYFRDQQATRWVLIGTGTAFYFIVGNLFHVAEWATVSDFTGFFGDFASVISNDAGRFIVFINNYGNDNGASLSQYSDNWHEHFGGIVHTGVPGVVGGQGRLQLRNADGSAGTRLYNVAALHHIGTLTSRPQTPAQSASFFAPLLVSIKTNSDYITSSARDDAGRILPGSLLSPVFRGFLPGAIQEVFPRYTNQPWPVTEVLLGKNHFLVRSTFAVAPLWINMEEWP